MKRLILLRFLMAFFLSLPVVGRATSAPSHQEDDPVSKALELLEQLTPEERVGQLFLVSFEGNQAPPESRIYDLIFTYHVGGVILDRENNNFVGTPSTLEIVQSLIYGLHDAEEASSQDTRIDPSTGEDFSPVFIPLLVGVSQEGDGYPNDQILSGLSPQANAMTLGATWQPDLAYSSGELLGAELSALGINLLIGPSLDVSENPRPESAGDIGARSFGGDPFWVSQMGQAYIEGVHVGSNNQIAVVAKHLPGYGSSDRPLEEEIPTIRKSLTQLTQIELAPFFAVTGNALRLAAQTDAMLMAHIRYQGFQGNIRATTRPVSFDPQAFSALMELEAFASWREAGGVIISDSLGTRAVRRYYDASEQEFNAPLVARDAFLAGNDMLYLGNFISSDDADSYTTIIDTVEFFAQKYREDIAFAERVDEAVVRILALKYSLYTTFSPFIVRASESISEEIGENEELIFEIGLQAATLLSPGASQIPEVLPEKPRIDEQIVFIIDSYEVTQCEVCANEAVSDPSAFEQAAESLYGPGAGNQIAPGNVTSYSFRALTVALDTLPGIENLLLSNLQSADWVVFANQDVDVDRPDSLAFQRLLSERPDLIQDKTVIVFTLNAPYYLDATDITKITAYYGLFNKQTIMADVAVRILFQEISTPGASPVSISGTGYDLIEATSPDPERLIPLTVTRASVANELEDPASDESAQTTGTPQDEDAPTLQAGDLLELIAGPILDHNGHPVPDNTPVTLYFSITSEGNPIQKQLDGTTQSGNAQFSYSIESEGSLEIRASSGSPQAMSEFLQFDVIGINAEGIALQATQTAAAQLLAGASAEGSENGSEDPSETLDLQNSLGNWFLSVLVSVFMGLLAYQTGSSVINARWGVRWALAAMIGGLLSASYLALDFPGSSGIIGDWGAWGVSLLTLLGASAGWLFAWRWKSRREEFS